MRLIDTHVHLDFPQLADEIDAVLRRARDKGVSDFVVPGVELDNWQAVLDLCTAHSGLYPALGLHPVLVIQIPVGHYHSWKSV